MITSARQGRKEETEKSLWIFFFYYSSPLPPFPIGMYFRREEEEAAGGRFTPAALPAACEALRPGGGLRRPPRPGQPLVNHCRPLSPAPRAHWKTLVNQQMMPSNFPISSLRLAEKRLRSLRAGLCTSEGKKCPPAPIPLQFPSCTHYPLALKEQGDKGRAAPSPGCRGQLRGAPFLCSPGPAGSAEASPRGPPPCVPGASATIVPPAQLCLGLQAPFIHPARYFFFFFFFFHAGPRETTAKTSLGSL